MRDYHEFQAATNWPREAERGNTGAITSAEQLMLLNPYEAESQDMAHAWTVSIDGGANYAEIRLLVAVEGSKAVKFGPLAKGRSGRGETLVAVGAGAERELAAAAANN